MRHLMTMKDMWISLCRIRNVTNNKTEWKYRSCCGIIQKMFERYFYVAIFLFSMRTFQTSSLCENQLLLSLHCIHIWRSKIIFLILKEYNFAEIFFPFPSVIHYSISYYITVKFLLRRLISILLKPSSSRQVTFKFSSGRS